MEKIPGKIRIEGILSKTTIHKFQERTGENLCFFVVRGLEEIDWSRVVYSISKILSQKPPAEERSGRPQGNKGHYWHIFPEIPKKSTRRAGMFFL
jgi:hypothetical protein